MHKQRFNVNEKQMNCMDIFVEQVWHSIRGKKIILINWPVIFPFKSILIVKKVSYKAKKKGKKWNMLKIESYIMRWLKAVALHVFIAEVKILFLTTFLL